MELIAVLSLLACPMALLLGIWVLRWMVGSLSAASPVPLALMTRDEQLASLQRIQAKHTTPVVDALPPSVSGERPWGQLTTMPGKAHAARSST